MMVLLGTMRNAVMFLHCHSGRTAKCRNHWKRQRTDLWQEQIMMEQEDGSKKALQPCGSCVGCVFFFLFSEDGMFYNVWLVQVTVQTTKYL